jgi:hypothetical protein
LGSQGACPSITPAAPTAKHAGFGDGRQGFVNYAKEWWHFSLPVVAGRAYDFPIARREKTGNRGLLRVKCQTGADSVRRLGSIQGPDHDVRDP